MYACRQIFLSKSRSAASLAPDPAFQGQTDWPSEWVTDFLEMLTHLKMEEVRPSLAILGNIIDYVTKLGVWTGLQEDWVRPELKKSWLRNICTLPNIVVVSGLSENHGHVLDLSEWVTDFFFIEMFTHLNEDWGALSAANLLCGFLGGWGVNWLRSTWIIPITCMYSLS